MKSILLRILCVLLVLSVISGMVISCGKQNEDRKEREEEDTTSETPESPAVKENILKGKSALFVGDSITEAICEAGLPALAKTAGWPGRIGTANDMRVVNKGLSGASVSSCRGSNTVLAQLQSMKSQSFDLVIMHGGVNDAWDSAPIGKMTDPANFDENTFDQDTFAGGLEYLFWYAKENYPTSVLGYIINFRLPGASIGCLADMSGYFEQAKKICEKWDIPYLDMYGNDELNARMKGTTRYAMGDYIHPNDRGYDILYPYVEDFCKCIMEGGDPSTLTDPAPISGIGNGISATEVNLALGKKAIGGSGTDASLVTDGDIELFYYAGEWGVNNVSQGIKGNCYVQIDLEKVYELGKINVVTFIGNLLYQWEAYVTIDQSQSIDKWTKVGGNAANMSYEDGNTIVFEGVYARYVRIYGIYSNAASAFVFNEISVYKASEPDQIVTTEIAGGQDVTLPDKTTSHKATDGNKLSDPMVVTPLRPGYVTVDYGAQAHISRLDIYTQSNLGAYKVYASNDGNNFTYVGEKAANVVDASYDVSTGCRYSIPINGAYRYIRIEGMDSSRSDYCCWLGEVVCFGEDGTRLTATSASAVDAVLAASNVIDGNYTSYCYIKKSYGICSFDIGKAQEIRRVMIYPASTKTVLYVQASLNNSSWITIATIREGSTEPVMASLMNSFRYFRIVPASDGEYSIYEIEVFTE